jgi:cytochrome c oxidase assembly protein subunit 15
MVDIAIHRSLVGPSSHAREWIARFTLGMAAETVFLMALGSATRVMNAGLACPDWPLCYGELIPHRQMNLQVFLEWFHRLTASSMGLFAIALVGLCWWHRRELPKWTPWIALLALFLVVFQGILGGLTVTELLRFDLVTAHLGTALLFFVTLLSMGIGLQSSAPMVSDANSPGIIGKKPSGNGRKLAWVSLSAAILVYGQSILGALVGSRWALHQCLSLSKLCTVMNRHMLGIVPPTFMVLVLLFWALRMSHISPVLRRLAIAAGLLVGLQICLGFATFKLRLQVESLTVSHQLIGALLLGSLVAFTVHAFRDVSTAAYTK